MRLNQHPALLIFCTAVLSMCCLEVVSAEQALYLQRTEQAKPSMKQLDDSEKLVREHEDVKIIERTRIQPFHQQPDFKEFSDQSFCTNCHLPIPHRKNLRARTFLNMHTTFIACETCHFKPEDITLDYQWFNFDSKQIQPANSQLFKVIKPQTADEMKTFKARNSAVKITPFYREHAAVIFRDDSAMQSTINRWKNGGFDEKVKIRANIHAVLENKGPDCEICHQQDDALLDLQSLGANAEQIKAMTEHRIPQFFSNYTDDDQRIRLLDVLE